jgi:hypothetical protein
MHACCGVWFETYSKTPAIMAKAHRSKQPLNLQAFLAQPSSLPMAARVSQRQNAKEYSNRSTEQGLQLETTTSGPV